MHAWPDKQCTLGRDRLSIHTAVKVALEHSTGTAIDILVPYTAAADEVRIELDSADAAIGARKLWS